MMALITLENLLLSQIDAYALSFTTHEGLSDNPMYKLEFQSPDADVDLEGLLGEGVNIQIECPNGEYRTFFAYIIAGFDNGQLGNKYVYRLELSTWLWFLMQNRNCRIFQELNTLDIIEQIFERYRFADYRIDVECDYPLREYCVQFSETDFNFMSRLLEEEGIWYYFLHENNKHTLVITDKQNFSDLDGEYAQLDFVPDGEEKRAIRESVQRIQRKKKVRPTEVVLRDFDYFYPRKNLQTKVEDHNVAIQGVPLEWYDYATGYTDTDRGEYLAQLRLEAMSSDGQTLSGESNALKLMAGRAFSLDLHPDPTRNRRFKLLRCDYIFIQDGPDSTSIGRNVTCSFITLNDDAAYRPLLTTTRPQMPGIQSATVVGAVDSEVHTDPHARIRVHFHWDRYKTNEEDSSCWIRVVQSWAGKGWGVIAMPRVGQEVLITYVDGDLDRPLVIGIVYNGDNPPPYQLTRHINYSGLVSRSLQFGQPRHANLLTFDDNRNNERIMLHAERDMQGMAERNWVTVAGNDAYDLVVRTVTDWYANHFHYTDFVFGMTGFSCQLTGVAASCTGVNISCTGVSMSYTGVDFAFTGVAMSFTGVSTSFTGVSTSFTGHSISMTGVSDSITGTANSFTSESNSLTGVSNSFTGESTSIVGSSISMTGSSISTTGSSISMTGSSIDTTGSSISTLGSGISTTGSSISTTGSSISTTGSSISTTGSSIDTTGSSISTVGSSISTMGLSISIIGASYSEVGVDLKTLGMQSKN